MFSRDSDGHTLPVAGEPTAEQVTAYLRCHPSFLGSLLPGLLAEHPDLTADTLLAVLPERPRGDNVADFQIHVLRHLRQQMRNLKEETRELLHNARANLSLQTRTHEAALAVLRATGFDALARTVSDELPILLDVDLAMLCTEQGLPTPMAAHVQDLSTGAVDRLVGHNSLTRLRPDIEAEPSLYGAGAETVRSDALVRLPLSDSLPAALLALGSRRAGTFHPGQGTNLLVFLATVIGCCIDRWANP